MDRSKLTPMMHQYFSIKDDYKDFILFYRLGDFYEMFFDDAITASRELELTLTGRNAGLEERAPLCGVPYHAAETYIAKLIEKGYKVAICDQTEDPALSKGLVKREVVKIITPGTITNPAQLDDKVNNFIMSIAVLDKRVALIYSDISTFEISAKTLELKDENFDVIHNEILKINPKEILVLTGHIADKIKLFSAQHHIFVTTLNDRYFDIKRSTESIKLAFGLTSLIALGIDKESPIVPALGAFLEYILETQKIPLDHFTTIDIELESHYLSLDQATVSNLELIYTLRNHEKKGTLAWVLDKTKTAMGSRLLKRWIIRPLRNLEKINSRHEIVDVLYKNDMIRDDLQNSLSKIYDLERLVSKLIYSSMLPRDFIAIKQSLEVLPNIKKTLSLLTNPQVEELTTNLDCLEEIFDRIDTTLVDEPPALLKDGGYIRDENTPELSALRNILANGKKIILDVEHSEREKTGIKSLKVKYNRVFGYYIDITKSYLDAVPDHYIRKQTLANSERYITEELKEIENKILTAHDQSRILEQEIYSELKKDIVSQAQRIIATAQLISKIDVLCSFALVAKHNNYKRPVFNQNGVFKVEKGRHPVIEKIVGMKEFINNNAFLDHDSLQFHVITGPNMAGKSTYLRQNALIAIMAQSGSFVPCEKANLMIFDRVFTRVGASDDLSQGQSTFMVEMTELANILRHATEHSLVLLDEIGRGTSTYDGLSIAWAVVEYLTDRKHENPKTLFATHYHELTELEGRIEGVKNYHITAQEVGEDILFLRKISEGRSGQSYGIQVAQLAGVPHSVIKNAKRILRELEQTDIARIPKVDADEFQVSFLREDLETKIIDTLRNISIEEMTPLQALNELSQLKHMIQSEEGKQ
jgi:DNA mismatch repair protein MutS